MPATFLRRQAPRQHTRTPHRRAEVCARAHVRGGGGDRLSSPSGCHASADTRPSSASAPPPVATPWCASGLLLGCSVTRRCQERERCTWILLSAVTSASRSIVGHQLANCTSSLSVLLCTTWNCAGASPAAAAAAVARDARAGAEVAPACRRARRQRQEAGGKGCARTFAALLHGLLEAHPGRMPRLATMYCQLFSRTVFENSFAVWQAVWQWHPLELQEKMQICGCGRLARPARRTWGSGPPHLDTCHTHCLHGMGAGPPRGLGAVAAED